MWQLPTCSDATRLPILSLDLDPWAKAACHPSTAHLSLVADHLPQQLTGTPRGECWGLETLVT